MAVTNKRKDEQSLEEMVIYVLSNERLFTAPELTNVVAYQDKIVVKIEKVLLLQKLAEQAQTSEVQCLITNPVLVKSAQKLHFSAGVFKCSLKIFLDGVSGRCSKAKFASIATSMTNAHNEIKNQQLAVIAFLRSPCGQLADFQRSFRARTCRNLETYVGIHHFISKETFLNYICNEGTVTLGFKIILLT